MLNRFGQPVEIVTDHGAPFLPVDSDLARELVSLLTKEGFNVGLSSDQPVIVDSLDPDDPGECHVEIQPSTDLDRLQDYLDRLEVNERRGFVEVL